jgi:hypothetical protein
MQPYRRQLLFWSLIVILMVGSLGTATGSLRRANAQGDVLLEDTFKDDSNKWALGSDKNGEIAIADGALTIKTIVAEWIQWTFPEPTLPSDVDASVTAQAVDPDKANEWYYGIAVRGRAVGQSNGFYLLSVSGDGSWSFEVTPDADKYTTLTKGKLKDFKPDDATTLRVVAVGAHFTLYVNDLKVGVADDSSLEVLDANLVMLAGGNYTKTASQLVKFTDLKVVAPAKDSGGDGAEPTAEAPASGVLPLTETFPDNNPNQWWVGTVDYATAAIADGALSVEITKPDSWSSTNPSIALPADVDASVTAQAVDPYKGGDWYYMLCIRAREDGDHYNFYYLGVYGSGNWYFGVHQGTQWTDLKKGKLKDMEPDAATALRIVAAGKHFAFYLNGDKVGEVDDSTLETLEENQIALLVGTQKNTPKQLVKFTDVNVVAP